MTPDTSPDPAADGHGTRWRQARAAIEDADIRSNPTGEIAGAHSLRFRRMLRVLEVLLRATGLFWLGRRRALSVRLQRFTLAFDDLPDAFDGYRVLHITDLHLDAIDGLDRAIHCAVAECDADLCVITGDYREGLRGPVDGIGRGIAHVLEAVTAPDGVWATLGNHDDLAMVDAFEPLGMRFLNNRTVTIRRGGDEIHITGVDDPYRFFTPMALDALAAVPPGFRIAAVHSPELAAEAAEAGYALYLCGHTHGGQICLPGGRPLVRHLFRHREFAAGHWRCGAMRGYTSSGAGVCGTPVRYFSRGEATLITLRRASSGS